MCFIRPSARIGFLPISEKKQLISGDKKTFRIKTNLFQELKKHVSSYVFCLCFFRNSRISYFGHACPKQEIRNLVAISRLNGECAAQKIKKLLFTSYGNIKKSK